MMNQMKHENWTNPFFFEWIYWCSDRIFIHSFFSGLINCNDDDCVDFKSFFSFFLIQSDGSSNLVFFCIQWTNRMCCFFSFFWSIIIFDIWTFQFIPKKMAGHHQQKKNSLRLWHAKSSSKVFFWLLYFMWISSYGFDTWFFLMIIYDDDDDDDELWRIACKMATKKNKIPFFYSSTFQWFWISIIIIIIINIIMAILDVDLPIYCRLIMIEIRIGHSFFLFVDGVVVNRSFLVGWPKKKSGFLWPLYSASIIYCNRNEFESTFGECIHSLWILWVFFCSIHSFMYSIHSQYIGKLMIILFNFQNHQWWTNKKKLFEIKQQQRQRLLIEPFAE